MIRLFAGGKINLTLNVGGKYAEGAAAANAADTANAGGYHEISGVVTSVDVCDRVDVKLKKGVGARVFEGKTEILGAAKVCAERFFTEFKKDGGADIFIKKEIPVCGGMGGSSAGAAAVLYALANSFGIDVRDAKIDKIARESGSDIAFLLRGGMAEFGGKGDDLRYITPVPKMHFLLLTGLRLDTKAVFAAFDKGQNGEKKPAANAAQAVRGMSRQTQELLTALLARDFEKVRELCKNDLEAAAESLAPEQIGRLRALCARAGVPKPAMTGSGGTFFVACENKREAQNYAKALNSLGVTAVKVATNTEENIIK